MLNTGLPRSTIQEKIISLITRCKNPSHLSPFNQKIEIMAVLKYAKEEDIIKVINDGQIKILGENRVQDTMKRWEKENFKQIRPKISLHFIGHLQTNKVSHAVKLFDYIDSLDSIKLAAEINKQSEKTGKKMPVLIQLKTSSSPTQSGILPEHFEEFMMEISKFHNLSPAGVMTIAPNTTEEKTLNSAFSIGKTYYDKYFKGEKNKDGYKNYFSAGMSGDFEIAIKNGANLVRIGSLLFQ